MSDIDLSRYRRDERDRSGPPDRGQGTSAFLGRVTSAAPSIGTFMTVQPVYIVGDEAEGSAGTVTDAGVDDVAVYLPGPGTPVTDDQVVCQFANYRWVAAKLGTGGGTILSFLVRGCPVPAAPFGLFQAGVTVAIHQGATTITRTTNSSGVVNITVPSAGAWTYTVTGVVGRQAVATGSVTAVAATTVSKIVTLVPATGFMCLGALTNIPIPQADLTLVDSTGTYTLTWDTGLSFPSFAGPFMTRTIALENFPLCDGVTTTSAPLSTRWSITSGDFGQLRFNFPGNTGCSGRPSNGGGSPFSFAWAPTTIVVNSQVPFNATFNYNFGVTGLVGTYTATVHE